MSFECPFCEIAAADSANRVRIQNEHGFVIRDGFPLTEGHSLVIPNQHVRSFFDLTVEVQTALLDLVKIARNELAKELGIVDLNVGINDGPLAGQTVPHCHIHLIPRRDGDVSDPRGGVRWIITHKADYWT